MTPKKTKLGSCLGAMNKQEFEEFAKLCKELKPRVT
jgi:hypothetical protein